MSLKNIPSMILSLLFLSSGLWAEENTYEIQHDRPAIRQAEEKLWNAKDPVWQKYCLPIGNGKIGAMVYGGVTQELAEAALLAGLLGLCCALLRRRVSQFYI